MACPYFEPVTQRAEPGILLPLRDFWSGSCHSGASVFQPDERLLGDCCNMGYARGRCPQFPQCDGPDAVRFTIVRDAGSTILLSFAVEKDHRPHTQGALEFSRAEDKFVVHCPDELLEKQARAYLAGYLRRRPATA